MEVQLYNSGYLLVFDDEGYKFCTVEIDYPSTMSAEKQLAKINLVVADKWITTSWGAYTTLSKV